LVVALLLLLTQGAGGTPALDSTVFDRAVREGIQERVYPAAALVIGTRDSILFAKTYGRFTWSAASARPSLDSTFWDLASLTKVVATTAAAMLLVDRGKLRLDERVTHYLPTFGGGAKDQITIRDLLTHRSGLPAGRDLPTSGGPDSARKALLATSLVRAPGSEYEYSDVGLDVMGFVIERIVHEPLDQFVQQAIYAPLRMRSTMYRPPPALRGRIAPTESRLAPGEVQDPTARALGGVAGNAGLFSTASDLAVFAQLMLDGGVAGRTRLFADSVVRAFTTPGPGWRGLGWETCPGSGSCGHYLSSRAFGHTGFTGTSMWIDPERDLVVIVLTNWIHGRSSGGVAPVGIVQDVRGDIADLAALSITDGGPEHALPSRLRTQLQIGWGSGE